MRVTTAARGNLVESEPRRRVRSWKHSTVTTSALVFVSAIAGIYTQAVLAATLGLSGASDAFFAALALTLFTTFVVNTSVLNREVPELAGLLDPSHAPTAAFWKRVWRLTRATTAISAGLGVLLFVGADWAITLVAPGLPAPVHELAVTSLRIMGPPLAVQLSASGLVAAQYALQGQALIQSTALLYSAAVIAALVLLTARVGPTAAAIGAGVAYCLMFLVVVVGTLRLARRPASPFEPPPNARRSTSIPLVTTASIVLYGHTIVGPLIASTLGEGTVAQLSFSYRPVEVVARGLPAVIAATVMPSLAAAHARNQVAQAAALSAEALRLTLILVMPAAAVLTALREPVVRILYQRAAFSVDAVDAVVPTLAWFAAALPAMGAVVVLTSIFFSVGHERRALGLALFILLAYTTLAFALATPMGGVGIALAFFLANVAGAIAGVMVDNERSVHAIASASWLRWTVGASALAFVGGSAGVELTRGYPAIMQLLAGAVLGSLGPTLALIRIRGRLVGAGRTWLAQLLGRAI
jgi:putative peptidoglycan lipid II flippase